MNSKVRWTLYWLFWTAMGLSNSAGAVVDHRRLDPEHPAWHSIVLEMSSLYTIGLLCPLVVYLTRRYPFTSHTWIRVFCMHLAAMVPFSLAHTTIMVAIRKVVYALAGQTYAYGSGFLASSVYEFYKDVETYWVLVLIGVGIHYYYRYRERELQALNLQARLAEARLENLRGQLHPHFLFNTLNMISSKMYEDVADADRMMTRLAELLRWALESARQQEVPLAEELRALRLYLDIMQARFQDSVEVRMYVDETAQLALAPALMLQPLVENAFRHGLTGRAGTGQIEVEAVHRAGRLRLSVRDNGSGSRLSRAEMMSRGFGVSNTARRLEQLYGADHRFDLKNREQGGFEAVIEIPYRTASTTGGTIAENSSASGR
jgi:sensor histidine kinase YesM